MHAVHNTIRVWTQIGRSLCDPRKYEEELFPSTRHAEHAVRSIPMIKECLREKRKVPVNNYEDQNGHFLKFENAL